MIKIDYPLQYKSWQYTGTMAGSTAFELQHILEIIVLRIAKVKLKRGRKFLKNISLNLAFLLRA